ncbi:MAG: hypothetical protein ACOCSK_01345 [Rhodothermales bacterium]
MRRSFSVSPVLTHRHLYGLLCLTIVLSFLVSVHPAAAQPLLTSGVVWEQPDDIDLAVADLRKMHDIGFNAVRTSLVHDVRILEEADRLDLQLFQELPLHYLSTARFVDTLETARRWFSDAVARGRGYASARHFGIGRYLDTTDSTLCAAVGDLIGSAREDAPASATFYYSTLFIEGDRCARHADLVLLETRDRAHVPQLVDEWYRHHDVPLGLASVGTWTLPDSPPGLRSFRSEQNQARFLENRLTEILVDGPVRGLTAFFIYRWRDTNVALPLLSRTDADAFRATYGLHSQGFDERMALAVVHGFLSGEQTSFAFNVGEATLHEWPWLTIMGWTVLLLIGLLYALSPRLRHMVPRYFMAHGFFRDAIREGRDLLLGSSMILLLSLGLATGIIISVSIGFLAEVMAFRILLSWMPADFVTFVAGAAGRPWFLALLLGAIYVLVYLVWNVLLAALSRTGYTLSPGQVLMLVTWPQWPLVVLMLAALAITSLETSAGDPKAYVPITVVLGLWVLVTYQATARTIVDYVRITRVPAYIPPLLIVLNPIVTLTIVSVFAWVQYRADMVFVVRVLLAS